MDDNFIFLERLTKQKICRITDIIIFLFRGKTGDSSLGTTLGLWQLCLSLLGRTECGTYTCSDTGSSGTSGCYKVWMAQSFMTVACISSGISLLLLAICLLKGETISPVLARISKSSPVGSLVTAIIGTAVGISFIVSDTTYSLAVAAILGIVAIIVNLAGVIVAALIPINN